ncbi:hypothetical protein [Synechococcus sp. PROS-U-1]|uniref:hypothetical protein n=1 Tax=Synechococcus sp. PROS-U-1 TaxID=1400866 RepID=UPI0016470AD9|nr:hypothetical protein [Synechococcus sp. PROS-U-1]QNJ03731.1 hypothetical protein SynPROSU1_02135 [Synechococcus sp. PROS-U-1]
MTPDQADLLITALQSIASDLAGIRSQLNPHRKDSTASFVVDAINEINTSTLSDISCELELMRRGVS